MGRPRTINPKTGKVEKLSVVLAAPVAEKFRREAARRGVSVGQLIREKCSE